MGAGKHITGGQHTCFQTQLPKIPIMALLSKLSKWPSSSMALLRTVDRCLISFKEHIQQGQVASVGVQVVSNLAFNKDDPKMKDFFKCTSLRLIQEMTRATDVLPQFNLSTSMITTFSNTKWKLATNFPNELPNCLSTNLNLNGLKWLVAVLLVTSCLISWDNFLPKLRIGCHQKMEQPRLGTQMTSQLEKMMTSQISKPQRSYRERKNFT